jgi:hypothetical protein
MRHATDSDLDQLESVLQQLRHVQGLRERKRGYFSHGSRAFLHFHADDGDLYVDVRWHQTFQRVRITSEDERSQFLEQVRTRINRLGAGQ